MIIGIDASRAFVKDKTGIEEYSYQVIKHLRKYLNKQRVVLYTRSGGEEQVNFKLPKNWSVKVLSGKYFWTQGSLSLEMILNPIDVLFVPAHTLPFIHPQKSIVTVHGLEYEFSPQSYSFYSRVFHRFFIKKSCKWSSEIITVSKKTKQDLNEIYKVSLKKMKVVSNGFSFAGINLIDKRVKKLDCSKKIKEILESNYEYLFFIGRLEERKNIVGIVKSFEVLKGVYGYSGKLLLAGKSGYGYSEIENIINKSEHKRDIEELGFLSDEEKWLLLRRADLFMFPSHSEGFGIPILEAQSMGTPVITSDKSPMKEVAGDKRILVNPNSPEQIASIVNKVLRDKKLKEDVIRQGLQNIKRFDWRRTAKEVAEVLIG